MKLIREQGDFDWVKEITPNPWLEWDGIYFDIKPTTEDLEEYINLALSTRYIKNDDPWSIDMEIDLMIMMRHAEKGSLFLVVNPMDNKLTYSNKNNYPSIINWVNYSQLKTP